MMLYNRIVEDCFFESKFAGFAGEHWQVLVDYAAPNSFVRMVFAWDGAADASSRLIRFRVCGGPYVIAACEWICRQYADSGLEALKKMDIKYWETLLEIDRSQRKTALQISDACVRLLAEIEPRRGGSNNGE